MAFTSGIPGAGSESTYSVQIKSNGLVRSSSLYNDLSGEDFEANKGYLLEIRFSSFGFSDNCITLAEVERVSIAGEGINDWNIQTIVTLVSDMSHYSALTEDFNVNHWIDGNDADPAIRRFDLNFAGNMTLYLKLLHGVYVAAFT